jgi:peptide/nickel transport system permease protein
VFLAGRLAGLILVILGITLLTFTVLHVFPNDPARLLAGPGAGADQIEQIRHDLGLDQPLPLQYVRYLEDLAHGNLGRSLQTGQPVANDLAQRLPATLELAIVAMLVYVVVSIPLGVIAAVWRGGLADLTIRMVSVAGLAVPAFWLGFLLQFVLYRQLGWFAHPVGRLAPDIPPPASLTGLYLIDSLAARDLNAFRSTATQLFMPVMCLVITRLGVGVRLTRASFLEVSSSDYARTARAKGLREIRVVYRHTLRNALMPVVTFLGLQFGYLLAGTLVVEVVFGWPGIGQYAIGSITTVDVPAIMSVTLIVAVFFVFANFLVDVVYMYLDPRLRAHGVG